MSLSHGTIVRYALQWLPQDRDATTRNYTRRFWKIGAGALVIEVVLLSLIIRYVPFTNVDYRAYVQQSRRFLNKLPTQDGVSWSDTEGSGPSLLERWVAATWFALESIGLDTHRFEGLERRYSALIGETGPLVYPALHLYIYTFLDTILPLPSHLLFSDHSSAASHPDPAKIQHLILDKEDRRTFLPLQVIWAGVYLMTMGMVLWIYREVGSGAARKGEEKDGKENRSTMIARKASVSPTPPGIPAQILSTLNSSAQLIHLLPLLLLSKRLHSIYVLRLFNDPLAMLLLYASVIAVMEGRWNTGSAVFSFGLAIKMNILLYLPGLLVLQFQYRGVLGMIEGIACILVVQLALPARFFFESRALAADYFATAFDLSRRFDFKWSVNLAFLGKERFDGEVASKVLLSLQMILLLLFAWFKWSNIFPGGTAAVLRKGLQGSWTQAPYPRSLQSEYHIPLVLFTSNFIGIVCARSLHYQFQSWYAHQLPLLLWYTRSRLWVCIALWVVIQLTWDTFPPSAGLSAGMMLAHLYILGRLFVDA